MRVRDSLLLTLALLAAYVVPLGLRPLRMPDEVRYAEISREMLETGNWVVPRLLGLPYFEKPVGGYWLSNLSQSLFGHDNFAVRFPSALATIVTALLVFLLARAGTGDSRKARLAVIVHLSSFMVWGIGTDAVLDPMLTMWLTGAMLSFWRAFKADDTQARFAWWSAFGAACGGAFLTKGFVALAVPVVTIVPLLLWHRRWREMIGFGAWSVIVATAVATPWSLAVHEQAPDYWNYFFWEEHIRRFGAEDAQHPQPFWYYLPVLLAIALPWTAVLPSAFGGAWRRGASGGLAFDRFLLLAATMPVVFLSLAKGKLATYILPCFPATAILIATAIVDASDADRRGALRASAWLMLSMSACALLALLIGLLFLGAHPYVAGQRGPALALGLGLLTWIAVLARALRRREGYVVALTLLTPILVVTTQFTTAHPAVTERMPQGAVRDFLGRSPNWTLACANVKLSPLLAWESGESDIVIVGGRGEVAYGLSYPEGKDRFFTDEDFPAWLELERRRRPVALFAIDSAAVHIERFPTPDRVERNGPMAVLRYERRE